MQAAGSSDESDEESEFNASDVESEESDEDSESEFDDDASDDEGSDDDAGDDDASADDWSEAEEKLVKKEKDRKVNGGGGKKSKYDSDSGSDRPAKKKGGRK